MWAAQFQHMDQGLDCAHKVISQPLPHLLLCLSHPDDRDCVPLDCEPAETLSSLSALVEYFVTATGKGSAPQALGGSCTCPYIPPNHPILAHSFLPRHQLMKTSTKLTSRTPVFIMPLNQEPQQAVNMTVKKTSPALNRQQSHMVLIWGPACQAQSLTQREFRRTKPQAGRVRKPASWGLFRWLVNSQPQSQGISTYLSSKSEHWPLQRGPQIQESLSV